MFQNYLEKLSELAFNIAENVPELSYIDYNQVAFNFKKARKTKVEEVFAEVTCLEPSMEETNSFQEGRTKKFFLTNTILNNGIPLKYVIHLYIPTFFNLSFKEKLVTIFHELYHISPKFDGELRKFSNRAYQHGPSLEKYDSYMEYLVLKYLSLEPKCTEFLKQNKEELIAQSKVIKNMSFKPKQEVFRVIWN
jgi:hypothetical protein